MAQFLRKSPYQVNMLIGGVDKQDEKPSLYWMDYLGTLQKVNYGAQGYCSNFVLSTMDCHWKEGMTVEEGKELMRRCIAELNIRFLISQKHFLVKLITKDGVAVIEL
jgi:20S proteasome subunit beta 4